MQIFTGFEYLLIDAANAYGLDKDIFEVRLDWANKHLHELEDLIDQADSKPLYAKAVMAIRKAQQGLPTGHLVGFDAVCSGMQLMSAMTGCEAGADATGLVDPNRRADAYTQCTALVQKRVPTFKASARKLIKQAVMTSLYGSKQEPKNLFGDGTPELNAFYEAMYEMAPGATELLDDLLNSWKPYALQHSWILPDGYDVRVKVMTKQETRIEVDELNHATFTYEYYENEGQPHGRSNVANVVHSMDAYLLRSLVRQCNYNRVQAEWAHSYIELVLMERSISTPQRPDTRPMNDDFKYLLSRYEATFLPDIRILDYCQEQEIRAMSTPHLKGLQRILSLMLEHKPFPIVSVHDEFKCHANNMNWLRKHYRAIMADIADSRVLDDLLSQVYGVPGTFPKKSPNLGDKIRQSNYALS